MKIAEKTELRSYLNAVSDILPLPILDREWSEAVAIEAVYNVALERRFGPVAKISSERVDDDRAAR
jgi:hypothetical protein